MSITNYAFFPIIYFTLFVIAFAIIWRLESNARNSSIEIPYISLFFPTESYYSFIVSN